MRAPTFNDMVHIVVLINHPLTRLLPRFGIRQGGFCGCGTSSWHAAIVAVGAVESSVYTGSHYGVQPASAPLVVGAIALRQR